MENFNGIISNQPANLSANRAFKYGDALFDTLKYEHHHIEYLEDHYFRLMASMRILRMEIPIEFTLEFYENEILKTIDLETEYQKFRIRVTIYRENGGYYLPNSNKINFLIEATPLIHQEYPKYEIDIFKDFTLSTSFLSTIKTTNRIHNVLASIYAKENHLQNCLLINDQKNIVEAINGNIFIIHENNVVTPPLTDGCINGIYRRKLIEKIQQDLNFKMIEKQLVYTDFLNASEAFLTNSIIGIQPITHFKKKVYKSDKILYLKKLMGYH